MTDRSRRTRRWVSAGAALAACAAASAAACGSFDEATPPNGADAGAADAAALDGAGPGPDAGGDGPAPDAAPACAKPLVTFSDSFTTLGSAWEPNVADGGAIYPGSSPDAGPGPDGPVLRAAVNLGDGGSSSAFVFSIMDVPPLASVDLSYVVLTAAKSIYAETGCRLALRNRKEASFTANLFGINRENNGAQMFSWAQQVASAVVDEGEKGVGLDVVNPARWHSVHLHIDVKPGTATWAADVMLTMTDLLTNEAKTVRFRDVPLVDGIDALQLDCGILFADDGTGVFESAVDEVSLSGCPR